jgi:hypothetical protein
MAKAKHEPADEPEVVIEEIELETVEEPVADLNAVSEPPVWIRAEAGESYMAIARRYFPDSPGGLKGPELVKLNMNRPLAAGVKVFLRKDK